MREPAGLATGARLRVGVFADGPRQPRWITEALAKAAALACVEIVVIAVGMAAPTQLPWLWRVHSWFERRLLRAAPGISEPVELTRTLPHARALPIPAREASAETLAGWRAAVADLQLDVAIAVGDVDDAALEGLARHGVWRYRFGEDFHRVEALAGTREAIEGVPTTASALTARCGPDGQERVLYQSWSRTLPHTVAGNRANLLRKTSEFVARALSVLHRLRESWLHGCAPLARRNTQAALPGTVDAARGLAHLARRMAHRAVQKTLNVDQWFIGYRFGGAERWRGDLMRYAHLLPPRDRYWADPFPLERAGRYYIFFEEYLFATRKAHINVVEVGRNGECTDPVRVLERPYHLSYPFLIEHQGELFMIPESGANRTVELWRCARFPGDWRLEKVLLRGARFVDATVHRVGGRWWMFVNAGVDRTELHDELHLYWADDLLGEWQAHPANPVKSDARSARPAGKLFERAGVLYRPAQICAPLYGNGVSINRVVELSPEVYIEREEERIMPTHPAGLLGLHTVNRDGDLSVVDGFMRRRRPLWGERAAAEPERLVPLHGRITRPVDNRWQS